MIASPSVAVTVRYLPRPVQQGSAPQIGTVAEDVCPAGNQQQQPLQSVHVETCGSAWHSALHDEASPPVVVPSVAPVDPSAGPVAPLSSLEGPPPPLELLQAASPTVDDAPIATMTWKSFSMFMGPTIPSMSALGTHRVFPSWHSRASSAASLPPVHPVARGVRSTIGIVFAFVAWGTACAVVGLEVFGRTRTMKTRTLLCIGLSTGLIAAACGGSHDGGGFPPDAYDGSSIEGGGSPGEGGSTDEGGQPGDDGPSGDDVATVNDDSGSSGSSGGGSSGSGSCKAPTCASCVAGTPCCTSAGMCGCTLLSACL